MKAQRSWTNSAMRINAKTTATSVPSMRKAALFSDCPIDATLRTATAIPAQKGLSQSIDRAMP